MNDFRCFLCLHCIFYVLFVYSDDAEPGDIQSCTVAIVRSTREMLFICKGFLGRQSIASEAGKGREEDMVAWEGRDGKG